MKISYRGKIMAEYCKRTCLQAEKKHRQQSPSRRYLQWNPAWNVPVRTTAITKATIIAYKISQGIKRPLRQLLKPLKAKRSQDKARGANRLTNMPERNEFDLMIPDGAFWITKTNIIAVSVERIICWSRVKWPLW